MQRRAQIAAGDWEAPPLLQIGLLSDLRERDFGSLDGLSAGNYDNVWPRDMASPFDGTDGVEPVADVCQRLSNMVSLLEKRHSGKQVILTAHADVIQISGHDGGTGAASAPIMLDDDDTLGEEDDIADCGDDDATLSSKGSTQEAESSIDVLEDIDMATGEEDEDLKPSADRGEPPIQPSNRFVIEQGMETVTHQADDAIVGAALELKATADQRWPPFCRDKKRSGVDVQDHLLLLSLDWPSPLDPRKVPTLTLREAV